MEIGPIGMCLASVMPSVKAFIALGLGSLAIPFIIWLGRQRPFPGRRSLLIANIGVVWWLLATAFELAVQDAPCKILASGLSHAGIILVPTAWMCFVYRFTLGVSMVGRRVQNVSLVVLPLLGAGIALTSGWHGLFYTPETYLAMGKHGPFMVYGHGPLFYAQSFILYVFVFVTLVLLFRAASTAQAGGHLRYWLLFTMATVPTAGNAGYLFFELTFWGVDPTPFLFAIMLLIYVVMLISDASPDLGALARQQVFNNLPQAIFVVAPGERITSGNPAAQTLLQDLIGAAGSEAGAEREIREKFMQCLQNSPRKCSAAELGARFYDIDLQPIKPAVGKDQPPLGWVMITNDVTATVHLQAELSQATLSAVADAHRDALTGLSNRRPLKPRFEELTTQAHASGQLLHVVLIDIDHFKAINDTYGHDEGDKALVTVAKALQSVFREDDALFRIGGEEFLALVVAMPHAALIDRLNIARARLNDSSSTDAPLRTALTFSAGLADWPTEGRTLEQLMNRADSRLLSAKREGRDRFVWHEGSIPGGRSLHP